MTAAASPWSAEPPRSPGLYWTAIPSGPTGWEVDLVVVAPSRRHLSASDASRANQPLCLGSWRGVPCRPLSDLAAAGGLWGPRVEQPAPPPDAGLAGRREVAAAGLDALADQTALTDGAGLRRIARLIRAGNVEAAARQLRALDTYVREGVPSIVWETVR